MQIHHLHAIAEGGDKIFPVRNSGGRPDCDLGELDAQNLRGILGAGVGDDALGQTPRDSQLINDEALRRIQRDLDLA